MSPEGNYRLVSISSRCDSHCELQRNRGALDSNRA